MQKFKGSIRVEGDLVLPNLTVNTILQLNNNNEIESSTITPTELDSLAGIASNIQDQLDAKIETSEKGANNGVATLDAGGKIPVSQLPSSVMEYKGTWNASTNSPTLADGTGDAGDVYLVSVAGTQDLGAGNINFAVGDWVVYSGSVWQKSINSNAVVTVNGQTGVVVLDTDDISEGSNLYHTDERAQDAVGNILSDSSKISLTYTDGTPSIVADIVADSIVNADISTSAAIARSKLASGTANHVVINDGSGVLSSEAALSASRGGTGLDASAAANGSLLIGNGSGLALATLTAGTGISITNGSGSITIATTATDDIPETSFAGANNQASPANVTGLVFSGSIQGFKALISVAIDATAELYEVFTLDGVNKNGTWEMSVSSVGDASMVAFDINNSGQVQYTSGNSAGFVSLTMKFRAQVLTV